MIRQASHACVLAVFMLITCAHDLSFSGLSFTFRCGDTVFDPANQTCCDGTVVDMPKRYCQCCNKQCYRPEDRKPDNCVRNCSGQLFHPDTELCCQGKVREARSFRDKCCGQDVINTRHQRCCGVRQFFAVPRAQYRCCGPHSLVYHYDIMRCRRDGPTSKIVAIRLSFRHKFQSQDVCKNSCLLGT